MLIKNKILMCYGKTPYTPGRYLEDGLNSIGLTVDLFQNEIDFNKVNLSEYLGVLFVESPSRPLVEVKNIDLVKLPKIFWIHHGENRLQTNVQLAKKYKPDVILMAHSLHLANNFSIPVCFFPFAMAKSIFNCSTDLKERKYDISFVGNNESGYYKKRRKVLKAIEKQFNNKYHLSFNSNVFLNELSEQYGQTKIVINHTADGIKSLNMRIFEGMSCGALVITDYVPGQEKLFIDNEHYIIYKNHRELLTQIDYYLNHLDEAQKIATAGYQHLLSKHTYSHRAYEIIEIIEAVSRK
ncbi:glycosyltransferase family protein (plasmid) [Priestia aryabhattai]|uniref:glycosyltransferase family protein n=1 Tax=Priestia aryabhattai TaxID=412384 RepID=UPI003D7F8FC0